MSPAFLMIGAALLFSLMAVGVKYASADYRAGEIVLYRSLVGLVLMGGVMRARRIDWRTPVPAMHLWRSASGTTALVLWFYAIGGLPLGTAMTLNYMSSVWIALFLMGGALLMNATRSLDGRLVLAVLAGFAGVAMVLRPTIEQDQLWHGLIGLLSGQSWSCALCRGTVPLDRWLQPSRVWGGGRADLAHCPPNPDALDHPHSFRHTH